MIKQKEMDSTVMRGLVWTGPALVVGMVIAMWPLLHMLPPPSPSLSANDIMHRFADDNTKVRIGCLLMIICWCLYPVWGVVVALFIRRMERRYPILTYASIALVGGGAVIFIMIPMTWAVCSFRVDTLSPETIQIMNDWVWFNFLYTWPPFSLWMVIIAVAILRDHNDPPIFPRWVGYYNILCAIGLFPAGMIAFFKTGPFAYNGLMAFWVVFSDFFGWMMIMSWVLFRAIRNEERLLAATAQEERTPVPA
jgi:hypothetical protein